MGITDKIFNLISIITLTGASKPEVLLCGMVPALVACFLFLSRADYKFYSALFSGKAKYYNNWAELIFFVITSVFGALLSIIFPSTKEAVCLIFILIGGCYFSIGGGISGRRILLCEKLIVHNAVKKAHPNGVTTIKINGAAVATKVVNYACGYLLGYVVAVLFVAFILSFEAPCLKDALINSAGLIGNDFYVLNLFGFNGINLASYSAGMKFFMCLVMLAGRIKTYLVLKPSSWRK